MSESLEPGRISEITPPDENDVLPFARTMLAPKFDIPSSRPTAMSSVPLRLKSPVVRYAFWTAPEMSRVAVTPGNVPDWLWYAWTRVDEDDVPGPTTATTAGTLSGPSSLAAMASWTVPSTVHERRVG